ncbi:hypothetical protein CGLAMM_02915 [Acetobacteraceae bacterium EV16G]|uniref:Lipoprotein n=1 Tax=Sorlinia euscelidii TaxID=3081148 RepID=A0ABU7U0S8_9PROT
MRRLLPVILLTLSSCATPRYMPICATKVEWPAAVQMRAHDELAAHPELTATRESIRLYAAQRQVLDACIAR